MITKEDKELIYSKHLLERIPLIDNAFYRHDILKDDSTPCYTCIDYETAVYLYRELNKTMSDALLYRKAQQMLKNARAKKNRLKKRVESMFLHGDCYFLTLTFTDEVLQNTNKETRKTYVKRYLKSKSSVFIANEDYGTKTHREHYHALVQAPIGTFKTRNDRSFEYGYIKAQICNIKNDKQDSIKIATYILKLANHSLKDSNKSHSVIYSKNTKKTI